MFVKKTFKDIGTHYLNKRWIHWMGEKSKKLQKELEKSAKARDLIEKIKYQEKKFGKQLRVVHEDDILKPLQSGRAAFRPDSLQIVFKGSVTPGTAIEASEEFDHALYNFELPGSLGYGGTEIYKAEKRGKESLHQVRKELGIGPDGFAQWDWNTLVSYVQMYRKCTHEDAVKFIQDNWDQLKELF